MGNLTSSVFGQLSHLPLQNRIASSFIAIVLSLVVWYIEVLIKMSSKSEKVEFNERERFSLLVGTLIIFFILSGLFFTVIPHSLGVHSFFGIEFFASVIFGAVVLLVVFLIRLYFPSHFFNLKRHPFLLAANPAIATVIIYVFGFLSQTSLVKFDVFFGFAICLFAFTDIFMALEHMKRPVSNAIQFVLPYFISILIFPNLNLLILYLFFAIILADEVKHEDPFTRLLLIYYVSLFTLVIVPSL